MLKKIRDAWLDALRSGEYAQTAGTLQGDGNQYCCLGVLCRVMEKLEMYEPTTDGEEKSLLGGLLRDQLVVRELMWRQDALMGKEGLEEPWIEAKLAEMNDAGCSFERIAEYIENVIPEEKEDEAQMVEGAESKVLGHNEGTGASQEAPLYEEGGVGGVGAESTEPA